MAGVPPALRREFSHQRQEIVAAMERHGALSAKGAQAATLDTRHAKGEHVSEPELRQRWAVRAEPFGFDVGALPRLERTPVLDVDDAELAGLLTESHATFVRRDVVRALAQSATQGASLDDLEQGADAMLAGPYAVAVAEGRWRPRRCWPSSAGPSSWRCCRRRRRDAALLATSSARCGRVRRSVPTSARSSVPSPAPGVRSTFVIGPAGTGKTFSHAAREAWESSGYRVLGASLAARAAAELQNGAGIPSQTIDRLRMRLAQGYERLDDRSVLVIDEAGMVGTRRLAAMLEEARAGGAKVVLVGDSKQLPEIDAGGLFAALAHRLGYAELTENRRQRDPEEREVVAELRLGHVEAALDRMQRHGSVVTADNADQLRDGLVGDWCAARACGDDVLMVAARRSTVADLNDRARELLAARGELGEEVLDAGGTSFAVGDDVLASATTIASDCSTAPGAGWRRPPRSP